MKPQSFDLLILGYGNPIREDDGFGWIAASTLFEYYKNDSGVEVLNIQQLTPDIAEPISNSKRVVFIDASIEGEIGKWCCRKVSAEESREIETHSVDPQSLLAFTKLLYNETPEAELITIRGERFGHGYEMSENVRNAVDEVVEYVKTIR